MADRRHFLRGLAALPLIGGSVAILGKPTQAAVPVTLDLMESYKAWLHFEHKMLCHEMAGYDIKAAEVIRGRFMFGNPGGEFHFQEPTRGHQRLAGWETAPQPSTRAAVVLSAAGCPLA